MDSLTTSLWEGEINRSNKQITYTKAESGDETYYLVKLLLSSGGSRNLKRGVPTLKMTIMQASISLPRETRGY